MLKADDLLQQVESVVCKQFFDANQSSKMALDLVSLYAFEFSKVPFEFAEFYQQYFNYIKTNKHLIAEQRLPTLSHMALSMVTNGNTEGEEVKQIWNLIRSTATAQLKS